MKSTTTKVLAKPKNSNKLKQINVIVLRYKQGFFILNKLSSNITFNDAQVKIQLIKDYYNIHTH